MGNRLRNYFDELIENQYVFRTLSLLVLFIISLHTESRNMSIALVALITAEALIAGYRGRQRYTAADTPVVAIDVDDTVFSEKSFPGVGVPYAYSIETINRMAMAGYEIIMWTSRGDTSLEYAKTKLVEMGLDKNIKFNEHSNHFSNRYREQGRKIAASIYIDDKAYRTVSSFENEWKNIHKSFLGVSYEDYNKLKAIEK